jgi:holo-[acyl-carrier protein] synthase
LKLGIDLVEIGRIGKLLSRNKENSLCRIWTEREIAEAKDKRGILRNETLAAGFACKEAVAKALGSGFGSDGAVPPEIEILHRDSGEPYVVLHGRTKEYFEIKGFTSVEISITHTAENAAAVCLLI